MKTIKPGVEVWWWQRRMLRASPTHPISYKQYGLVCSVSDDGKLARIALPMGAVVVRPTSRLTRAEPRPRKAASYGPK